MPKGCGKRQREAILRERNRRPFESIADLAHRVPELRRNELVLLASIGALNSIGCDKEQDPLAQFRHADKPAEKANSCIDVMRCGRWSALRDLPARCWTDIPESDS